MRVLITLCVFLTGGFVAQSQSGPGGVGSSVTNSFWLDANRLNYSNNDNVPVFDDISTNGNSFSQLVSTRQPIFKTGSVNGFPTVEFDGVNDFMRSGAIPVLDSPELTWYVVYKETNNGGALLGGSYASKTKQWLSYTLTNGLTINGHYSNGPLKWAGFTQAAGTYVFSGTHVSPTDIKSYKNGSLMQTKVTNYAAPSGHNYVALGHIPGITYTSLLDGNVAEAFAFSGEVNDLERVIIENYLGAKYGIAIASDFYSFQAVHKFGVIGIGDDGVDTHTDSEGAGIVNISSPSAMTTGEYLFAGNDGIPALPTVSADMPAAIAATHERYNRTWRVDETGEVGDVDITFNLGASFGFGNTSTYFLLVDTDGNFTNSTTVAGVYNALDQTVVFTTNLAAGDYFTLAGEPVPTSVNAIADGNWSNSATWDCACVPSGFQQVNINGFDIDLDIDGFAKDLVIGAGSTLEWVGSERLTIKEDLTVDGAIVMTSGTIEMSGDGTNQDIDLDVQVIEVNNIVINNPAATVTLLNGTMGLNGKLSLDAGTFNVNSANFIVRSDSPTTSGYVGVISPSASIVGSVTVERFIAAGVAGNRNLCSPVIGETLSAWDNDLLISGTGFPDGCAYDTAGCYYSVKKHQGSAYIDVSNINETLLPGVGYEIFIGDNLTTFSGATVSTTGDLQGGSFATPSFSWFWNLQGNPFASPISFPGITRAHVHDYFYIFDATSGSYQWYDGSNNTSSIPSLANGVISIGQAFWTGNWGFMTYPQSCKTDVSATFIRNSEVENALQITLKQDNSTFFSVASIGFAEQAKDAVDQYDIRYLSTGLETASSLFTQVNDTIALAKTYLERNGKKKIVDFRMKCKTSSYYSINPSRISDLQDYSYVYIYDKELNNIVDLGQAGTYSFYAEEGEYDRFSIILTNDKLDDKTYIEDASNSIEGEVSINQLGHTIEVSSLKNLPNATLEVTNLLGQLIVTNNALESVNGKQYVGLSNEYNGVFIAVVKSEGKVVATRKIIL